MRQCDLIFDTIVKEKYNFNEIPMKYNYSRILIDNDNRDFLFINSDTKGEVYTISDIETPAFIKIT